MSRFTRLQTLNAMNDTGLVPVFYNSSAEIGKKIIEACANGGAVTVEMTNRGDNAIDVFKELEKFCKEKFPKVILGVGSIVDAPTAAMYIMAGASFVVGPSLDKDTAILCNKRKIPYMPGCGSASEIHEAESLGVEICKIFPGAQVGGPEFVKAIKGPCPWTSIMPTGGVEATRESLTAWFSAGITCAGIGSQLITSSIIKNEEWTTLSARVSEVLAIIKEVRKK